MNWTDPRTQEPATGFRETGFLPAAFVNLLAVLGWNDGTNQELFTLPELVERFSMDRVHKGGAKFDYEKAKWFNHEWIKRLPSTAFSADVLPLFAAKGIIVPDDDLVRPSRFEKILDLVKDRCPLLPDFVQQAGFFYEAPATVDTDSIRPKWNDAKQLFFVELIKQLQLDQNWEAHALESNFKEMAAAASIKPGELLLPLRIMLVGGKFGPHVFDIAAILGREETVRRIRHTLGLLGSH
jgi:glutamyl-tRNA synthetase